MASQEFSCKFFWGRGTIYFSLVCVGGTIYFSFSVRAGGTIFFQIKNNTSPISHKYTLISVTCHLLQFLLHLAVNRLKTLFQSKDNKYNET